MDDTKMKKSGAKFYKTKFDHQWTKEWPFIKMGNTNFTFYAQFVISTCPAATKGCLI